MAEYMIYPKNANVFKVPAGVDPFHACFIEPLACSIHAVELGDIQFNDVVVVSGCGPLGLGMIAAARLKSPKLLIALDICDWKLDIGKKCGADVILNPAKVDLKKEIEALTEGFGCDVYIEATGAGASVVQGLHCIARHGRFVEYSVFGKEVTADWSIISNCKELKIFGGHLGAGCWETAVKTVADGRLPLNDIITHKLPLDDFLKGIKMVLQGKESIKIMLVP